MNEVVVVLWLIGEPMEASLAITQNHFSPMLRRKLMSLVLIIMNSTLSNSLMHPPKLSLKKDLSSSSYVNVLTMDLIALFIL